MLLRVLVHEAAHTFNLRHPNASALSWMNRPHIFDAENPGASYWEQFPFSFTREELAHLRHGEFRDVAMGGNPAAPALADSASFRNLPEVVNRPEWTIDIRSQGYFDFLEPVELEVRIRNCSRRSSTTIDSLPTPESGNLTISSDDRMAMLLSSGHWRAAAEGAAQMRHWLWLPAPRGTRARTASVALWI